MSETYVYQEWPKWRYHASGEARIVASEAEQDRLGPWWFDSPAAASSAVNIAVSEVILAPQVLSTPAPVVLDDVPAELEPVTVRRRGRPRKDAA